MVLLMKKIVEILILSFLLTTIVYADKKKSQLNLFFELPENYILSSELTLENIDKFTTSEKEKNEWINSLNIGQPYSGTEIIFTKKIIMNGGDHISLHSLKKDNYWTGEKIKNEFDNYCNKRLQVLKNANKDKKNKRNNEIEVIKNHKCVLIDIPRNVDFSVFESHLNLSNNNIVVYMTQFALAKSDLIMTVFLSCEKNCDEMLPIYENLIATTYFGECIEGDCDNGSGTLAYNDGSKHNGTFKLGVENGSGILTFEDGSKFIGNFSKGYMNGNGKHISADGSEYNGEFKKGLTHGKGTWTFSNGGKYVGDTKFGFRDGIGTETMPDGEKYVGGFKNDKKHGDGVWSFADGAIFEGSFDSERNTMTGKYTYSDGKVEMGTWDSLGNFVPSKQ